MFCIFWDMITERTHRYVIFKFLFFVWFQSDLLFASWRIFNVIFRRCPKDRVFLLLNQAGVSFEHWVYI